MLHDPGSYAPPQGIDKIDLVAAERDILKKLGEELAAAAALPVQRDKAALWRRLNDLDSQRPMVWINEIPWHEMNVDDELTLCCRDPWARELEDRLRRDIYQWKHMPADMVISDFIECPLAIHSTDFGIHEDVDIARTDAAGDIVSRHFNAQIRELEDLEKIRMPVVTHDAGSTDLAYEVMTGLFSDIMPVQRVGQTHIWFSPWDYLIRWWGIEEAMIDLINRPALVHAAVQRMVRAWMVELDQFEEQNLLSLDSRNIRVGSGGYGYSGELPGQEYDPGRVRPQNMWGCSNAQIFSDVSPEMHWEFAVEHDLPWLSRWGLTYYGCCEPLDRKIPLLKRIPNLRKISVSPWNDMRRVIEEARSDYVLSVKPSPAIFAAGWNPDRATREIRSVLELAGDSCHIEFIMKDISTVGYRPERLWEWQRLAMETVQNWRG